MKRKYKVFISSSFIDMKEARLELLLKTLRLGHIPAGMELLKAGEAKNLDVIEQEIATSDIYVVFVGARAGSQVPGEAPLTYTMKEFHLAEKHRLPIIPFLLNSADYLKERDKLSAEMVSEREQEQNLKDFREKVQQREGGGKRLAGFFSYKNIGKLCDDFGDAVREAVENLEKADSSGGWVEGRAFDQLKTRISLDESVSRNPFFRRLVDRLSAFKILTKRVLIEPDSKEAIGEYFCEQFLPRLDKYGITHVYFESGSSIAYVTRKFIEYVKEEEWVHAHGMNSRLKLATNNLLTYLDFLMVEPPWHPIEIQLTPHGSISHDYGATYGSLKSARAETAASRAIPNLPLPADAKKEVARLQKRLDGFTRERGLVLMATSGIDIAENTKFPGLHVGSYHNMLLKRCLVSLPCAKIVFVDERKWGNGFVPGNCFSVFDDELTWAKLKEETPLAIAMSVRDKGRRNEISESLKINGFAFQEWGNDKSYEAMPLPVIAGNAIFAKQFGLSPID